MSGTPVLSTSNLSDAAVKAFDNVGISAHSMLIEMFGPIADNPMSYFSSMTNDNSVLSIIFMYINIGLLTLGCVFLTYKSLAAVTQTAHDGDFMGKAFHTVWVPIRITTGVMSLIPIAGGWNAIQIMMLWVAVMGAGLGDMGYNAVLDGWMNKGATKTNIATDLRFGNGNALTQNAWKAMLCDESYLAMQQQSNAMQSSAGVSPVVTPNANNGLTGSMDPSVHLIWSAYRKCGSWTAADQSTVMGGANKSATTVNGQTQSLSQSVQKLAEAQTQQMLDQVRAVAKTAVAQIVLNQNNAQTATAGTLPDFTSYQNQVNAIGGAYQTNLRLGVNSILNQASAYDSIKATMQAQAKTYGFVSMGSFYTAYANSTYAIQALADTSSTIDVSVAPLTDLAPDSIIGQAMLYAGNAQEKTSPSSISQASGGGSADALWKVAKPYVGDWGDRFVTFFTQHDNTTPALVNIKNTADNMVVMAAVGITASGTIKGLMDWAKDSIYGWIGNKATGGVSYVAGQISPWLELFTFACQISFGFFLMCSIYLPLVPYIVFMGQIMEWLASVMVGVTAAPLLAFAHFDTDGEGLGQKTTHGYGFMLQIFLRPIFLVLGFILSAMIIEISIFFLTATFGMAVKDVQVHSMTGLFSIFGYCALYMTLAVGLVNASAALMWRIPEAIWDWLNLPRSSFQMDTSQQAQNSVFAAIGGAKQTMNPGRAQSGKDRKNAATEAARRQAENDNFNAGGKTSGNGSKGQGG